MRKNILIISILILCVSFADDFEYDYEDIFENHDLIRLIIDADTGAIKHANSHAIDFYGYSKEQLLSMKIQDINALSPQEVSAEMEAALNEERNFFVFEHQLSNGEVRTVEVYSYPIMVNDNKLLFSVVIDITEKAELQSSLIASRTKNVYLLSATSLLLVAILIMIWINRSKYKKKALIDPLTGAYSRLYLNHLTSKSKNEKRKHHMFCSLVQIDLDKFKYINDTFGHKIGDDVLKTVVATIKSNLRNDDIVIRYGGDEFILVLMECDENTAIDLVERIRSSLLNSSKYPFKIQFSYGIQQITYQEDLSPAIQLADERMYEDKKRNIQ
ncbi:MULTISPECIES: sensor domain-containing diguanylate cyclase [unclassified Fusibacter]|uniref:sensor domain-containing diguanylate cyclase n=1 Tax=unclassified Fusibacter TaxID=2624464 RepID=UPI0013E964B8|nr:MULTISPECIES: sensor domain-containing diguanylate cyclase [unclassified Fusibacter]MCK8059991.1 sensor domain-containing diguanylate cyclase [Fusibacter sp. A2]NPE22131.1 diguanylate cyclase [Fusibacter sp. A1]